MPDASVVIVGAGFSGLAQAVMLEKAGITDYVILEKADELGGTWRDNTYPGCACDVQSHLYSYSFADNPGWTKTYAAQEEILAYLEAVAGERGLSRAFRFGVEVTGARWDAESATWNVRSSSGQEFTGRFLVFGAGGLHGARLPVIPGLEEFTGQVWHSSRWNHEYDLAGKKVALVGVGASGVQIAPEVAEVAAGLVVFQRTAPWVLPKEDVTVPRWKKLAFRYLPGVQALYRTVLFWKRELRGLGFHHKPELMEKAEPAVRKYLEAEIADPELRRAVTPDYAFGCKRVLFSNDYYRALTREHVGVVPGEPVAARSRSLVDSEGVEHEVDAIILATGFDVTSSLDRIEIEGVDGRLLSKYWADGPTTYRGVAVPGFPNMFLLLGPNGFVAYTSVIAMIETQAEYIVRALRMVRSKSARSLQVRPEAEAGFQDEVGRKLARTVWSADRCRSWYQSASPSGTVLWPDSIWRYRLDMRRPDIRDYHLSS
ncbi:monooxygenase [Amycolatopsis antarctica]|uniref:Monooxygenase n=1 Tax=Amycolatopsis antarctica TaxID=1854586 RepID=A0A263CZT0_9PSEU|nr:NAD(P)/FAD-dependent oxidoreductase [Amycolatopsis antarctica]OZM70806.1 monooxygenase [Amycolatopsis antarctica]